MIIEIVIGEGVYEFTSDAPDCGRALEDVRMVFDGLSIIEIDSREGWMEILAKEDGLLVHVADVSFREALPLTSQAAMEQLRRLVRGKNHATDPSDEDTSPRPLMPT